MPNNEIVLKIEFHTIFLRNIINPCYHVSKHGNMDLQGDNMTQVSKYPLRKEIKERVYEVFAESLAMVKTKNQVDKLINDLLSPTERTMLAKRLSIALLLMKQYDQRAITNILKVSLGTVSRVSRSLQTGSGGYGMVVSTLIKDEKLHDFLQKLDDALANLLPPPGRNWSNWRRE